MNIGANFVDSDGFISDWQERTEKIPSSLKRTTACHTPNLVMPIEPSAALRPPVLLPNTSGVQPLFSQAKSIASTSRYRKNNALSAWLCVDADTLSAVASMVENATTSDVPMPHASCLAMPTNEKPNQYKPMWKRASSNTKSATVSGSCRI
jgi:hypothetical protein